jgi:hypothetical protein
MPGKCSATEPLTAAQPSGKFFDNDLKFLFFFWQDWDF